MSYVTLLRYCRYSCANSEFTCAHLREPLLRLEQTVVGKGDGSAGRTEYHVRRTMFMFRLCTSVLYRERPDMDSFKTLLPSCKIICAGEEEGCD